MSYLIPATFNKPAPCEPFKSTFYSHFDPTHSHSFETGVDFIFLLLKSPVKRFCLKLFGAFSSLPSQH